MKKILMMLMTFILVFTTLLPSYTAFSKELEDYCESMSFGIQTVKTGDEVIEGKAEPESEIKLEIDGFEEVDVVDGNGEFQFEIEEEIKAGIKISLMNNQHKIETEVKEIDTKIEMIESELDGECDVPAELTGGNDIIGEEEVSEEVNESESSLEEPVEETTEIDEEAVKEEVEEIDELSEETEAVEEDVVSPDESLEEKKVEKSTEKIDEETPEQTADEISEESLEDEKIEETTEEIDEETSKELIEEQKIEERAVFKTETNESSLRQIQQTKNSSVKVENYEEFKEALNNVHVTLIELTSNIVSNENGSENLEVKSSSNEKSINGNGFNIHLKNSLIIHNNLRSMTVKNANLQTSDIDHGFFNKENKVVDLYIENVTFDTLGTGKFGTIKEGTVYFSGKNIINTNSGDGYNSHALTSKNIVVNKNASLKIDHIGSAAALNFEQQKNYSYYGLEIGNGANLIIHSSSEVVSTDTLFTIDINKPNNIDYVNKSNGRLFNSGANIEFNLDQVSVQGWKEKSWDEDTPTTTTSVIDGKFSFNNDNTYASRAIETKEPDFSNDILPTMSRIKFSNESIKESEIDIKDTDKEITGNTLADVKIKLFDENVMKLMETESDKDGDYYIKLDEPFEVGTRLTIQVVVDGYVSETIFVNVVGNRLEFESEPDNMIFETTEISIGERIINRKDKNWNIKILNTRENKGWKLHAQATAPLKNDNGNTLEGALVFKEDKDAASQNLMEEVQISSSSKDGESGMKEISWDDDEGILLEVDPLLAKPDTEYSTTIEWTLTDGP